MNVDKINTFTETVINTFNTACMSQPESFRTSDFEKFEGEVINEVGLLAVIEFSGSLTGAISILMPENIATKVFGDMMMEEVAKLDEEVAEGFQEIISMIVGSVKASLTEEKLDIQPPQIFIEKGKAYNTANALPWLKIPMVFKGWGEYQIFIAIEETG